MRIAFLVLLLANVAYFAWANWVAEPARATPASTRPPLPELQLADHPTAAAAAPAEQPAPAEAPARCVSVGPFEDLDSAARAAATLQERGLATRQRAEQGAAWTGYWVYVAGVASAQDETRVLRRLERGGITDAHAMPDAGEGRRISLGLFSDRARADRRARAVERLGLKPQVSEQEQAGAAYWIDFDLAERDTAIAAEGLLSGGESGSRIEIRGCPTAIERAGDSSRTPGRAYNDGYGTPA